MASQWHGYSYEIGSDGVITIKNSGSKEGFCKNENKWYQIFNSFNSTVYYEKSYLNKAFNIASTSRFWPKYEVGDMENNSIIAIINMATDPRDIGFVEDLFDLTDYFDISDSTGTKLGCIFEKSKFKSFFAQSKAGKAMGLDRTIIVKLEGEDELIEIKRDSKISLDIPETCEIDQRIIIAIGILYANYIIYSTPVG